ncbi:DUF502 domain-containing protein [Spongiibacter taiwanensis]|uniref:DUF502 domain-containing protein n=1 Tax=Spongiibacter taiwanensis TaxID=1748242 RepID=UPI002035D229|nr:DUF502 domain-containing protein [Spongiibacter taiwanensis]USA41899.1 DUF502 domain-containing protein [Spongiibacter taiwanensis]
MSKLNRFIRQSFIGGFLVIAPIVIILLAFRWAVNGVRDLIAPLATPLARASGAPPLLIDVLVIASILLCCFVIGTLVATSAGRWLQHLIDRHLSRFAPGYRMVKDILNQMFGSDSNSPFNKGEVAVVKLYGADVPTLATAIVTSRHRDGWYTVFVPTGPNPTSGFVYHLPGECVTLRPDIKLDSAFRSIIACGAGSSELAITKTAIQP